LLNELYFSPLLLAWSMFLLQDCILVYIHEYKLHISTLYWYDVHVQQLLLLAIKSVSLYLVGYYSPHLTDDNHIRLQELDMLLKSAAPPPEPKERLRRTRSTSF
jgi:hypothetical protein